MKKVMLSLVVAGAMLGGCMSGPRALNNSVWDHQSKAYENGPFVTALVTDVLPIYPIVGFIAGVIDWVILNPVQFWGSDVWDGHGASYVHDNPEGNKTPWFK